MTTIDARDTPPNTTFRASVVIVGTGPAGITLAHELASTGVDILLVEGGGHSHEAGAQDTLRGSEASQIVEPLDKVREKRLGGTSHRWGGRTYPFDSIDFETRSNLDIEGWPITRENLLPYYRRASRRLDLRRFEWTAAEALADEPAHIFGDKSDERLNDTPVWRWSPPTRFSQVYRNELHELSNIRLIHHANVIKLIRDPQTGILSHVIAASAPGRTLKFRGDYVVLAIGGLETSRLLLASDIGNEHDQVGRNYMIHPIAEVGTVRLRSPESAGFLASYGKSHDGVWVRRFLQLSENVRRHEGLLNMGFALWYVEPRESHHGDPLLSSFALARKALTYTGGFKATGMHRRFADTADTGKHIHNIMRGIPTLIGFSVAWARDRWLGPRTVPSFSRHSDTGTYRIRFDAEQSPDPTNRVLLSREVDAFGVPRLDIQHAVKLSDRDNYHRSLAILSQTLEESGWGTFETPRRDELTNMSFIDGTHQMGLVRMGRDRKTSVVNEDLRVWSSPNLFCATSGVFPTSGMAGPTLTLVAISVRLADHLHKLLRGPATPTSNRAISQQTTEGRSE